MNGRLLSSFGAVALIYMLSACGSNSNASPGASAAKSGQTSTAPAASGSQQAQSQDQWNQTVAAAKREGQVVVFGQGSPTIEQALAGNFKKAYPDIGVVFTGATGPEVSAKILTERRAGLFTADLIVHGTNTIITDLMGSNSLDPLKESLVGPNDADQAKWLDGQYKFADEAGKYVLIFTTGVKSPLNYNPNLVSPGELSSYRNLLDPKWKGKIAAYDPRVGGAGIGFASFLYVEPSLGKEFMQQLYPGVTLTRDIRQLADWVARGQYPIALGTDEFTAIDMKQKGLSIELLPSQALKEGTYTTASWGSVAVMNKAPHPNAAKVYLDWLLSKDGQLGVTQASGYPSRRTDVPTENLVQALIPKPGVKYIDNYTESFVRVQREVQDYVQTIIPS